MLVRASRGRPSKDGSRCFGGERDYVRFAVAQICVEGTQDPRVMPAKVVCICVVEFEHSFRSGRRRNTPCSGARRRTAERNKAIRAGVGGRRRYEIKRLDARARNRQRLGGRMRAQTDERGLLSCHNQRQVTVAIEHLRVERSDLTQAPGHELFDLFLTLRIGETGGGAT